MSHTLLDITAERPEKIRTKPRLPGKGIHPDSTQKVVCNWEYYVSGKVKLPIMYLYEHRTGQEIFAAASLFHPKRTALCISAPEWMKCPERSKQELYGFEKIWKHPYQKSQTFLRRVQECIQNGKNVLFAVSQDCRMEGEEIPEKEALIRMLGLLQVPLVCTITFEGLWKRSPFWAKEYIPGEIRGCVKPLFTEDDLKILSPLQLEHMLTKAFEKDKEEMYFGRRRCEGLEAVLFQCPSCKEVGKIRTSADGIFCGGCGKIYQMDSSGNISEFRGESVVWPLSEWLSWQKRQILRQFLSFDMDRSMDGTVFEYNDKGQKFVNRGRGTVCLRMSGLTLKTGEETFRHSFMALPSAAVYPRFKEERTCVVLPFGIRVFYVMMENPSDAGWIRAALEVLYEVTRGA